MIIRCKLEMKQKINLLNLKNRYKTEKKELNNRKSAKTPKKELKLS